jgi:myo-inositol-1(or 4)-monophosphatase
VSLDPRYLATGVDAALEAGRIHRRYFRQHPDIHKKGRIDLVTNADLEAERMFRDLIAQRFPDHVVVGEEAGAVAPPEGRCRWIIDPVDGTTNFAHGLALFCVSIALEIDGRLALGVVYDPINEELFTAERGEGARLNGEPIHVSSCAELVDGLLVTGFPYTIREERRRQVDVFAAFLHEARPCGGSARRRSISATSRRAGSMATGKSASSRGTSRPVRCSSPKPAAR